MPATQTAPAAAQTIETRTTFACSASDSYAFDAKYAGVCAWTGARIYPGDKVQNKGAGIVSLAAMSRWDFRSVSAQPGAAYGECASRFERVSDADAALARCLAGTEIEIIAGNGYTRHRLSVRNGAFMGGTYGMSKKSTKQVRALLAAASAFSVRVARNP